MIDLCPDHLEVVRAILADHVPRVEVRAFGSRVRDTAKATSDLDLALFTEEKIQRSRLNRLVEAFEESDLPFRVDVLDWQRISREFRRIIDHQYHVIQEAAPAHSPTQGEADTTST
ncbi:MAG: nucleotidyltransferase domain-containing protein [Deltaproteobacteria bacterium]|nr:nucleotidyltransferase domain-containing protein [Deltaproteobacteria bacterium]